MALSVQPVQQPTLNPKVVTKPTQPTLNPKVVTKPVQPTLSPRVITATPPTLNPQVQQAANQPPINVDNSPRFIKLGEAVKTKFPGVYDSYESGALGKIVATQYPGIYDSFIDPAVKTPQPAAEGVRGGNGVFLGTLKGMGSTVSSVSSLGQKALEKLTGVKSNSPTAKDTFGETLKPKGIYEKIGFGAEQIGEFFLPGGAAAKAGKAAEAASIAGKIGKIGTKVAQTAAIAGTEAGATFGLSKAQGQSNKNALVNSAFAGALPVASAALAPLKKSLAGRFINSLIKPKEVDFRFGKNPGLAVAEEGIVGNTLNGLKNNIAKARQTIGQQIDKLITTPKTAKIIQDVTPAFAPIDNAITNAINNGEQELVTRLLALKNGLTKTFKLVDGKLEEVGSKNLNLNPKEIQTLKIKVGEGTRWTGQAFDTDVNQVKTQVYYALNDLVEKAAPGTKKLNKKYGNLLTAEKAVEKRAGTAKKNNLISLPNLGFGGIGAVAATVASGGAVVPALAAGAGAIGVSKVLGSTAVKSRVAKQLSKPAGKGFGLVRKTYFGTRPKD